MTQSEPFFPKLEDRGGLPLLLSCMPVSVAVYVSISLNIPKYPWKCWNKLFWLCQGSECDAWSSYVWQTIEDASGCKYVRFLNLAFLYRLGLDRVLNMFEYDPNTSIMPNYATVCFNVPQYAWTWLNIAECSWVWLKMSE